MRDPFASSLQLLRHLVREPPRTPVALENVYHVPDGPHLAREANRYRRVAAQDSRRGPSVTRQARALPRARDARSRLHLMRGSAEFMPLAAL